MNRFRVNLHPAFFWGGSPETYGGWPEEQGASKADIQTLKPEVINNLSNVEKEEYYIRVEQRLAAFKLQFQYLDSKDASVLEEVKKNIQKFFYGDSWIINFGWKQYEIQKNLDEFINELKKLRLNGEDLKIDSCKVTPEKKDGWAGTIRAPMIVELSISYNKSTEWASLGEKIGREHETTELENGIRKDLRNLKTGVEILESEKFFSGFRNTIINDIKEHNYYYHESDYAKDRKRFEARCNNQNWWSKSYEQIWEDRINKSYKLLIDTLKKYNYFSISGSKSESEIKTLYEEKVKKLYKDKVWYMGDKKFNQVKDTLFAENSDNPANKIYKDLTHAATLFVGDKQDMKWYDVEWIRKWEEANQEGYIPVDKKEYKKNVKFLSQDLPDCLRNLKKTPKLLKALRWIPFINVEIDKPSEEDKKAIKKFLETANKLPSVDGRDPAILLIEILRDSKLDESMPPSAYEKLINSHGVNTATLNEKQKKQLLKDIIEVWAFFRSTQNAQSNHAIYLSVLEIIKNEWWATQATNKYKSLVEEAKQRSDFEKKNKYQDGETLKDKDEELWKIATKLRITDFTNANRLVDLKKNNPAYFKQTGIPQILANLNMDEHVDSRDNIIWGSKTGQQFLRLVESIGEDKAINNLLERAKLDNKILWLGINEEEFTKEQIEAWNTKLILLLQNIISSPWEDFNTLLRRESWADGTLKDPFEWLDLEKARDEANKKAKELYDKIDIEWLKTVCSEQGMDMPDPTSIQKGLATSLYTEYRRWIGLWRRISFDEWIKWVWMNVWVQYRNDWALVVWIWFDYSKMINLWKWRSITPELSAWAFVPLMEWKPKLGATAWADIELAKKRITDNWIVRKFGFDAWATYVIPLNAVVLSAWFSWSQDKLAWIGTAELRKQNEFYHTIISPVLNDIYKKLNVNSERSDSVVVLNFNDENVIKAVREVLTEKANSFEQEAKKAKIDINSVVDSTMRLLLPYNWANIADERIRELISQSVAEQYAMAWGEARKAEISKKGYDIEKIWIWAFWVVWTKFIWAYLNMKRADYNLDWYGNRNLKNYNVESPTIEAWDENSINEFNDRARLKGKDRISLNNEGFIVIPKSIKYKVKVNTKLEGAMKQDSEWNVLLDPQTPMATNTYSLASMEWSEIIVWWQDGGKFEMLDNLPEGNRFVDEIDKNKILQLGEGIKYDENIINNKIEELKQKLPEDDPIREFDFSKLPQEQKNGLIAKLEEIQEGGKKAKIELWLVNWKVDIINVKEWDAGKWFEIDYQVNYEIFDKRAKDVADAVYTEALKLENPYYLRRVKHDATDRRGKKLPHRAEYDKFINEMKAGNYVGARKSIGEIFKKLDDNYKKQKWISFTSIYENLLNKIDEKDNIVLGEALMSINNIFARALSVRWWSDNYRFINSKNWKPATMWSIIERREGKQKGAWSQIRWTLESSKNIPDEYKNAYLALLDASWRCRTGTKAFEINEAKAKPLTNTIWFNLWDHENPENPLFDPEIYDPMVDLDTLVREYGFTQGDKDLLHKRAMENFANNKVLIAPILKVLWLDWWETDPMSFSFNWWTLTFNVKKWEEVKEVTLKANLNFGYFTQCVNHTLILSDVRAESEWKKVECKSSLWKSSWREASQSLVVSKTSVGVSIGFGLWEDEEKKPSYEDGSDPSNWRNPTSIPTQTGGKEGWWSWGWKGWWGWGWKWGWNNPPDHNDDWNL